MIFYQFKKYPEEDVVVTDVQKVAIDYSTGEASQFVKVYTGNEESENEQIFDVTDGMQLIDDDNLVVLLFISPKKEDKK